MIADFLSRMHPDNKDPATLSYITHEMLTNLYSLYETHKDDTMTIHLVHNRLRTTYHMKPTHEMYLPIADFIRQYVLVHTIPLNGFVFHIKNKVITSQDTPTSLALKSGDTILVTGETYTPETYDISANLPILCMMRQNTNPSKPVRAIQFIDRLNGKEIHYQACLDISKNISTIPFTFYTKHLRSFPHSINKGSRNHVVIPIRLQ